MACCFSPSTRASDKSKNRFYLVSMANGGQQVGEAAEMKYVPLAKAAATKACAKIYGVPNMSGWCPLTLMDQVRSAAWPHGTGHFTAPPQHIDRHVLVHAGTSC